MRADPVTGIIRFASSLRLLEASQVAGFASLGILFALDQADRGGLGRSAMFVAATFLLYAAVYSFNSYGGYTADIRNVRLAHLRQTKRSTYAGLTVAFVGTSLLIYGHLARALVILAGVVFLLWCFYSLPRVGLKHFPLTGTLVHVATQIVTFQMAALAINRVTTHSLLVSLNFAVLFAAGHIHHELLDYSADREVGDRTLAVTFGPDTAIRIYISLLVAAAVYWLGLAASGVIRWWTAAPFLVAQVLQIGTAVVLGLTKNSGTHTLRRNQSLYRVYYAIAALAVALQIVPPLWS